MIMRITFWKICLSVCATQSAILSGILTRTAKTIETYMAYKQTAEYRASEVYRLEETLRQFNSASGYNDIFIPAMCRLSDSYRTYHEALQLANEKFLQQYPEWGGGSCE